MTSVAIRVATMSPSAALAALGCALFLLSSSAAVRRALGRGDARAVASVAAAAALVAALLAAVRAHDRARGVRRRALLEASPRSRGLGLPVLRRLRAPPRAPEVQGARQGVRQEQARHGHTQDQGRAPRGRLRLQAEALAVLALVGLGEAEAAEVVAREVRVAGLGKVLAAMEMLSEE